MVTFSILAIKSSMPSASSPSFSSPWSLISMSSISPTSSISSISCSSCCLLMCLSLSSFLYSFTPFCSSLSASISSRKSSQSWFSFQSFFFFLFPCPSFSQIITPSSSSFFSLKTRPDFLVLASRTSTSSWQPFTSPISSVQLRWVRSNPSTEVPAVSSPMLPLISMLIHSPLLVTLQQQILAAYLLRVDLSLWWSFLQTGLQSSISNSLRYLLRESMEMSFSQWQYCTLDISTQLKLKMSMKPMLQATLSHKSSCPQPPSSFASFLGIITRSFLHILGRVTAKAYLYTKVFEFMSCEISCLEFFTVTGRIDPRKSISLWAWVVFLQQKFMPSSSTDTFSTLSYTPCFRMSCSTRKKVFLWSTCWRTCTTAPQVCGVNSFLQSSHCMQTSTNSVMKVCSILVLLFSSFSTVSLTFMRLECGSVQTKPALMILARFRPLIFFSSSDSRSLLSLSQKIQGGRMQRWQNLQKLTMASLVIPTVISVLEMAQASQMLPMEGRNWMPHMGQRMVTSRLGSISIVDVIQYSHNQFCNLSRIILHVGKASAQNQRGTHRYAQGAAGAG